MHIGFGPDFPRLLNESSDGPGGLSIPKSLEQVIELLTRALGNPRSLFPLYRCPFFQLLGDIVFHFSTVAFPKNGGDFLNAFMQLPKGRPVKIFPKLSCHDSSALSHRLAQHLPASLKSVLKTNYLKPLDLMKFSIVGKLTL